MENNEIMEAIELARKCRDSCKQCTNGGSNESDCSRCDFEEAGILSAALLHLTDWRDPREELPENDGWYLVEINKRVDYAEWSSEKQAFVIIEGDYTYEHGANNKYYDSGVRLTGWLPLPPVGGEE